MRVIKHGDTYEIGIITCPSCGCVFAYTNSDVKTENWTDYSSYDRDEYSQEVVRCPECHIRLTLEGKRI